ncbi:probable protein phosphatase 2C 51 [Durio zibethinus]|uniref:protein-serine/threonine phosphatase n=1 Tax=Durio zibethinus TaxID=66656 RepID=A0A6P6AHH6_DURZI|nr:probable protein phosphatase 2C 51 [Durio zibethinus]
MEVVVKKPIVILLVFIVWAIGLSKSQSSLSYKMIYSLGGAPSILDSQDYFNNCSFSSPSLTNNTINCHYAILQGRRNYQEDRLFCDLNIRFPFVGKEVSIGMAAVFDGHGGAEASEMASKLVLDYFLVRSCYIQFEIREMLGVVPDESMHMGILKEALVRTIRDIDITFTKLPRKVLFQDVQRFIVVVADNQILVANVGDSKVVLCSEKFYSLGGTWLENNEKVSLKNKKNTGLKFLSGKELTRDHHPDREDERRRIEAAGGYVVSGVSSVPRVNGRLAVSRAIGDLYYKNFGVIAVPEMTDWQPLTRNDSYLVISSDRIFEKLNAQDVCQLLPNPHILDSDEGLRLFDSCQSPLPECISRTVYEEGSMDNLSVIVVPLREAGLIS